VLKKCSQCIWFSDCKSQGEILEVCPFYDGLLNLDQRVAPELEEETEYESSTVGYDDYQVYEEQVGWVKVIPALYKRNEGI